MRPPLPVVPVIAPLPAHADPAMTPGSEAAASAGPPRVLGARSWGRLLAIVALALVAALLGGDRAAADTVTAPAPVTVEVGESVTLSWVWTNTDTDPNYCEGRFGANQQHAILLLSSYSPVVSATSGQSIQTSQTFLSFNSNCRTAPGTLSGDFTGQQPGTVQPDFLVDTYETGWDIFDVGPTTITVVAAPVVTVTGASTNAMITAEQLPDVGCAVQNLRSGTSAPAPVIVGDSGAYPRFVTATCTYQAGDSPSHTSGPITFLVRAPNTAPTVFGLPTALVADEDTTSGPTYFTIGDDRNAGTDLAVSATGASRGDVTLGGSEVQRFVTYIPAADANGTDSFTITVTDLDGAVTTQTVNVTITPVNDPPVFDPTTVPGDFDVEATGLDGASPTFTPPSATDIDGDTVTVTCSPASGDFVVLVDDSRTVTCTANDGSGATNATATSSFTVTVRDTTPPVISQPADVGPVEAETAAGAAVAFQGPSIIENIGPATLTCVIDGTTTEVGPGDRFPIGVTTVSCTAADTRGNTSPAKTFIVTVSDTTRPVIDAGSLPGTGTPSVLAIDATGPTTVADWAPVTATDAVAGPLTLTCRVAPDGDPIGVDGTGFAVGDTLVTCATDDGRGNALTVTFTVRVTDTTAPVLTGVPAPLTAEATGRDGATVTWDPPTATDAVDGDRPVTCDPAPGTLFPRGATTVTCTAADRAGNPSTATFTVTVRDTTGPVITWQGGPQRGRTYTAATLPKAPTCTATDVASVVVQCRVTGYATTPGRHIMTARARDTAGNATVSTVTYTVSGSSQPPPTPPPTPTTPTTPTQPPVVTPAPTQPPVVTPAPTQPPVVTPAPTRPPRGPVATPAPTQPSQPAPAPTRPPRR